LEKELGARTDLAFGSQISKERQQRIDTGLEVAMAYVVRTIVGMSAKAERLHLRIDAEQKALLEAASQATGASVSTFVLAAATEAAAEVLADRRVFVLDQDAWRVFDEALARPAGDVAGLRELLATPTVLDAGQLGKGT
jgi:uncharacterized protein (DUF1778 family)